MPKGVYDRSKSKPRKTTEQEIPLDAIPERITRPPARRGRKATLMNKQVYLEYSISDNQLMMVMGKVSLPFRVKP